MRWIALLRASQSTQRATAGLAQFFNLYQVVNFFNHATDLRSSFYFYRSQHLAQTESNQSALLALWSVDTALYLSDFNLSHGGDSLLVVVSFEDFRTVLAVENLLQADVADAGHLDRLAEQGKSSEGCLYHVVWIG